MTQVTFDIPTDVVREIERLAVQEERSRPQQIRFMLKWYIEHYREMQQHGRPGQD
jgi:metal-responsive CopG/Arc/MetJ family transcriptional regulator